MNITSTMQNLVDVAYFMRLLVSKRLRNALDWVYEFIDISTRVQHTIYDCIIFIYTITILLANIN